MKGADLDYYVEALDYLDHDYDPERDDKMVQELIVQLGDWFPIAVLEQVAKHYKEKAVQIESKAIPDLLMEAGQLTEIKTANGLAVSLKTEYTVKTLDKTAMFVWVSEKGGEDLYKATMRFSKGEDISPVLQAANEAGLSYDREDEINSQTLKKFVKDYIEENGEMPPAEAGTVTLYTRAVVKKVKK